MKIEIKNINFYDTLTITNKELNPFYLFRKEKSFFVGIFNDNVLRGFIQYIVNEKRKKIKIQIIFVNESFRKMGFGGKLLDFLLNAYPEYDFFADALITSFYLFKSRGFVCYREKQFKNFYLYYMRLLRDGGICKENEQSKNG